MKKTLFCLCALIISACTAGSVLADGFFEYKSTEDKEIIVNDGGNSITVDGTITATTGVSSVNDNTQTVVTAGVRVQLSSSSVPCKRVFVQAHESNAGTLVVGGSNVVAALSGRRGFALFATQGDWFETSNLNLLYIDSTSSGDKVNYFYEA